jgi:2-amino-4-hydroxy-6-hydroxymethyldihydropteridine diphosphokinase
MDHHAFIGLGSNQGDKIEHCEAAIKKTLEIPGTVLLDRSGWYVAEPWGKEDQEWFVNGVIRIATSLDPHELLGTLKEIERRLGRKGGAQWGPRPIDLDILFYDQVVVASPVLNIPHPLLHLRNFVLVPLAEIAPEFFHPLRQETIRALLAQCPDLKLVRKMEG